MFEHLRRSMLVRFFLVFVLGVHALMGAMSLYLRTTMVRTIHSQINKEILDSAKITLHRLEVGHVPGDKELLALGDHQFLRITDPEGNSLVESEGMGRVAPSSSFPLPRETWTWAESLAGASSRVKVVSVRFREGWIQVARDMHTEEAVLVQFRKSLRLFIWLVPFVAIGLGYLLSLVGLRPFFRTVALSVQSVGPENLVFSIDCKRMPIELDPICKELSCTFQRLKTSFDRLSAMNADLAHELRTPIHAMQLELEGLLDRTNLPSDLEEPLVELTDHAAHMASVVEQMLFLARVEDPSQHLEKQPIDLVQLLEQGRAPFQALAEERKVRISLQVTGQPCLEGDPTLLRQAIFNLLGNALRHSPPGGEITLQARGDDQETILEVRDQGRGLPDHIRKNLGQRFLRAEQSRDRSSGGAGLGLAIVQGIATMHGATLALEEGQPSGCRAMICFPRN